MRFSCLHSQIDLTVLGTGSALAVRPLLTLFATSRLCVLRSNDVLVQRRIRLVRRVTWRTSTLYISLWNNVCGIAELHNSIII